MLIERGATKLRSTACPQVQHGGVLRLETFLTYHQVEPEACSYRYQVRNASFEQHLQVAAGSNPSICRFTFDDGYESQLRHASRLMDAYGLEGWFFVTTGRIGRRSGYMNWPHIRELAANGHAIGSHSVSHPFLPNCSDSELSYELSHSKQAIEDQLGAPVHTISIPGGRWNRRVLRACEVAGYTTVFTSDPWERRRIGAIEVIGRFNVTADVTPELLKQIVSPKSAWARQYRAKIVAKRAVRSVIGDRAYHALWRRFNHMEEDED